MADTPGVILSQKRTTFESVSHIWKQCGLRRTSKLSTPIERLEDHSSEVLTCEFHPYGELLMSAGLKNKIHICNVYGKFGNVMILKGHWGAIMEAHFSTDGSEIYSCSSDEYVGVWDTFTGIQISCLKGHMGCVNTVQCARNNHPILCSGSDDSTVRIWDLRQQVSAMKFENGYHVTATCFSETAEHVFTGGLEADIKIWDVRLNDVVLRLQGHSDAVTGITLSPCGSYLLSHSIDNTLRIWDIRPTYTGERCIQVFDSNQHIVNGNLLRCSWSPDGTMISAGSSDEGVPIWDVKKGIKLTELLGHECTINDVDFHPKDPVLASASSDEYVFLHEML